MASFKYDILVRRSVNNKLVWFLASNPKEGLGNNVLALLNKLGGQGWEVVGSGDYGGDTRSEIILKQQN